MFKQDVGGGLEVNDSSLEEKLQYPLEIKKVEPANFSIMPVEDNYNNSLEEITMGTSEKGERATDEKESKNTMTRRGFFGFMGKLGVALTGAATVGSRVFNAENANAEINGSAYVFLPQAFEPGIDKALEDGNKRLNFAWANYKNSDYHQALRNLNSTPRDVKTQEPAYWVLLGLVDNAREAHANDGSRYMKDEIKYLGSDLKKNKPVYHFAEGMNKFRAMWIPEKLDWGKIGIHGGSLKDCKETELDFLKGMFSSLGIKNYEREAKTFQNTGPDEAKKYFSDQIQPLITNTDITPEQKWWYAWNVAGLFSNFAHMAFNYNEGNKRHEYSMMKVNYKDAVEKKLKGKVIPEVHNYVYADSKKFYMREQDMREHNIASYYKRNTKDIVSR